MSFLHSGGRSSSGLWKRGLRAWSGRRRCDKELVAAFQDGDKASYEALVGRHYRSVFGVCLGMLGSSHAAEDAAQEVFLKGFERIAELRSGEQFGGWMRQIARNVSVDLSVRPAVPWCSGQLAVQQPASRGDNHDLEGAIRRLPVELRGPLMLYYFGEGAAGRSPRTWASPLVDMPAAARSQKRTAPIADRPRRGFMSLSCDSMKDLAADLVSGVLPEELAKELEQHLKGCSACRPFGRREDEALKRLLAPSRRGCLAWCTKNYRSPATSDATRNPW